MDSKKTASHFHPLPKMIYFASFQTTPSVLNLFVSSTLPNSSKGTAEYSSQNSNKISCPGTSEITHPLRIS